MHGEWCSQGSPPWSIRHACGGEQASHYSVVYLGTGEAPYLELAGSSSSATSAVFLRRLRAHHPGPLVTSWDNGPAHGGEAMQTYLGTPDMDVRLYRLPAYSPDCNVDEAIWARVREEAPAHTCPGAKAAVQEQVGHFFDGLRTQPEEVTTPHRVTGARRGRDTRRCCSGPAPD